MDPDPGHNQLFQIFRFFGQKNFRIIFLFFYLFFCKLNEPFRDKDILDNPFFEQFRFEFQEQKIFLKSFWSIFCHLIQIQQAKMLRIHQIRILSTVSDCLLHMLTWRIQDPDLHDNERNPTLVPGKQLYPWWTWV